MSSDDDAPKQAAPAAKPAMSRFLKSAGDSDSDESSDEEESEMSSDEEEQAQKKPKLGRFVHGASSDDESDEDVKRVVKSARDKRLDEMEATGKSMENALKINDWVAISTGALIPVTFVCTISAFRDAYDAYHGLIRVRQARADGAAATKRLRTCPAVLCPDSC